MTKEKIKTVDEYILSRDEKIQGFLSELRTIIKETLPCDVTEKIAWNMPSYWKKKYIIHFEAYRDHVNIYVGPVVVNLFKDKGYDYKFTGRGVSLAYDKEIPKDLIEKMTIESYKLIEVSNENQSK